MLCQLVSGRGTESLTHKHPATALSLDLTTGNPFQLNSVPSTSLYTCAMPLETTCSGNNSSFLKKLLVYPLKCFTREIPGFDFGECLCSALSKKCSFYVPCELLSNIKVVAEGAEARFPPPHSTEASVWSRSILIFLPALGRCSLCASQH